MLCKPALSEHFNQLEIVHSGYFPSASLSLERRGEVSAEHIICCQVTPAVGNVIFHFQENCFERKVAKKQLDFRDEYI